MINPEPVLPNKNPYGSSPVTSNHLPHALTPTRKSPWRRTVFLFCLSLLAAIATYAGAQYVSFRNNISVAHEGESSAVLHVDVNNPLSSLDPSLFHKAGDGRFNILVAGIGGGNHPGGLLTDSLQVISLDTINHSVGITSVPRDLYANIPGYGRTKINAAYEVGEQNHPGGGPLLARQVVGQVLGVNISNFVLLDFSGAEEIIDTLGGIDVNVPTTISDPFFPDDTTVGYSPFYITAGLHHMDGHTALRYARSRETTSDFDRSARQQLIISALKQKALSLGVLSNPLKISQIISEVGQHFKTDMSIDEIKTFLQIYKDIPADKSSASVLDTTDELGLLTSTTDPVAGYIIYPDLGMSNFSAVQQWFQKHNPDPLIGKEAATVTVANGGRATSKQLQNFVDTLKDYGYAVNLSTKRPDQTYQSTQLFEARSGKKPFTRNYLSTFLSTSNQSGSPLNSGSDFEILYVPSTQK